MSSNVNIPESDRIPLRQKIAFALGGKVDYIAVGLTTNVLWMPYFNIGLGISPFKLGVVLMLLRAWDAISDPIMGNISDNARTRWGRRRPFMFIGAIALALLFPFIWRVPVVWGETATLALLTGMGLLFFSAFTCFAMPYFGLQLELTPNYDERTRLTAWMALCSKIVTLGGGWILALVTCSWFTDPTTGEPNLVHGVKVCSWFIALVILGVGLLPPLFVKERYYRREASQQARDPFWKSIKESSRCMPLWLLIGISFFLVLGNYSITSFGQYINIYVVNHGDLAAASLIEGWKSTAMVVAGIAGIPFWTWLSEKLDKKHVVGIILLVGIAGHLLNIVCINPERPYLQLIPACFQAGVMAAVWLFLGSMKADASDYDELNTSRRREGSINAFYSWFIKAALTSAMLFGGGALELSGFDVHNDVQSVEVLTRMKFIYVLMPAIIWCCAFVFIYFYPLNRKRMADIRSELELRRGKL